MERDSQTCRFLTDVVNLTLNSNRSKSECSRMKERTVMFEDLRVHMDLNKTDFFQLLKKNITMSSLFFPFFSTL